MADFSQVIGLMRRAQSRWLGYRFIVVSAQAPNLPSVGISEIRMPQAQIETKRVPSLSSRADHIPVRETYTDLVLRAPTIRDSTLWNLFQDQLDAMRGRRPYVGNDVLIVGEFDASTAFDLLPIALWVINGQPKSFQAASANAQSAEVALEELTYQVDSFKRMV